jgi:hypothetical protein
MKTGCRLLGLALCVSLLLAAAGAQAQSSATNQLNGVKFVEKMSRKVVFHHYGPIIGDKAELVDKGVFSLMATFPLDGVDITQFTSQTHFTLGITTGNEELFLDIPLAENAAYQTHDTKDKVIRTATFQGKTIKVLTFSMRVNPALAEMTVKIKGSYAASTMVYGSTTSAGYSVLADNVIGQSSGEFRDSAFVLMGLYDNSTDVRVGGVATLPFAGQVVTTPKTDPEIGTYNQSKVGFFGASSP